ncbi:hypothetical protein G7054_g3018 [Neopestalotiopsis clavispora]|nr:hypothetical protein G7054_g3018 [Neopestalotiopsis clavispora]
MTEPKRTALLIGCPSGELTGPDNDVEAFNKWLVKQNFDTTILCGARATRDAILEEFAAFISNITPDAVVVVYYAGHGGIARPPEAQNDSEHLTAGSRTYQFLVPVDFEQTSHEFRGILDVEISYLFHQITNGPTKNVTIILDCCHSGRLARAPSSHPGAIPRGLRDVQHQDLSAYVDRLVQSGQLKLDGITSLEGNKDVVRVVATDTSQKAYEYLDKNRKNVGALTNALIPVLDSALEGGLPWRDVLSRVGEIVNSEFGDQHPHVEGPFKRKIFSTEVSHSDRLLVTRTRVGARDVATLNSGKICGIRIGNKYALSDLQGFGQNFQVTAKVVSVSAFTSRVEVSPRSVSIPRNGAGASLIEEACHRWPILLPEDLRSEPLPENRFLRVCEQDDQNRVVAEIRRESDGSMSVYNGQVKCWSNDTVENAIGVADRIARAQNLLSLTPSTYEAFKDGLHVEICRVVNNTEWVIKEDQVKLRDGDRITFNLRNNGDETIYVSVFDVDVLGVISHISAAHPRGIEIKTKTVERIYDADYDQEGQIGLPVAWPDLPDDVEVSVPETIVFIVSRTSADLRDLCSRNPRTGRGESSQLEQLMTQFSFGSHRGVASERTVTPVQWNYRSLPFSLERATA